MSSTALLPPAGRETMETHALIAARVLLVASVFFMPLSTAATNVSMGLCLIAWLASGQWHALLQTLQGNRVAQSVIILFALTCVGSLYSSGSVEEIAFHLSKQARLLFFIPALTLLSAPAWRHRCIQAFIVSMGLTLVLSIISTVIPLPIVKGTAGGAMGNHFVFKDHIAQNLMMSFFVLVMLASGQLAQAPWVRRMCLLLALIAVINILFMVQGRTGYVSLALNLAAFLILLTRGKQRLLFAAMGLTIVWLTLTFSAAFQQRLQLTFKEYSEREKKELTSVGQRVEFLQKSLVLIGEKPILGHGTGSYGKEFCRIAESSEWCEVGKAHPHNQFMSMGVQFGLVGILAYIYLLGSVLWNSLALTAVDRLLGVGLMLTLLTDSLFHAPLFLVGEAQFFTLMLAVILAAKARKTNSTKQSP